MVKTTMTAIALCCLLLAVPLGVSDPTWESRSATIEELRGWDNPDYILSDNITRNHRLIGFGCGKNKTLTMTAIHEDHFPSEGCKEITSIEEACPPDPAFPELQGEPVTASECARYWGDGW